MGKRQTRATAEPLGRGRRTCRRRAAPVLRAAESDPATSRGSTRSSRRVCQRFYAETMGRPSLPPGHLLPAAADRLLRGHRLGARHRLAGGGFVGAARVSAASGWTSAPPDHSTISRTRRLIDLETHRAVFTWVLQRLVERGLLQGQDDRRSTRRRWKRTRRCAASCGATPARAIEEFLTQLAQASGIETPTREDLAKIDRKRKKKGSNDDWTHPHDPDAKITKMKDGRTHLAHKAEHAVDLETGAIVAVTLQGADEGDTTTIQDTLADGRRATRGRRAAPDPATVLEEVVADKGYHSNDGADGSRRRWRCAPTSRSRIADGGRGRARPAATRAVYANRRRIRGARGKRLLRRRGELLERPFAHLYETGGMRRTHLRGHENILKRLLRPCRRLQSRALDADADRRRHAARPPGPPGGARRAAPHALDLHLFRDDGTLGSITRFGEITGYRRWIRHHGVVRLKNATCTSAC